MGRLPAPDPPGGRRARALLGLLAVAAPLSLAPLSLSDPDTLANLAVGRAIAEAGGIPREDPFSVAGQRFATPEWLADLGWHGLHVLGGERALVGAKLALLALAWFLAYRVALARGARPAIAAALLVWVALASPLRLGERNELHACWLLPLTLLLLSPSPTRSRLRLLALLPLGALWANLHSSFVLGWPAILAALIDRPADRRPLGLLLAAQPLLGLASPLGLHNYDQLLDHLANLGTYRVVIAEWGPPGLALGVVLGLLSASAAASLLPACNRRERGALLLLAAGALLALGARRFPALGGLLLAPLVAANLSRASLPRRRLEACALAVALLLCAALAVRVRLEPRTPLGDRPEAEVARHLARVAPAPARLLAPYDLGPFLLRPGVRLFVDPRNSGGAAAIRAYLALLADPDHFAREAARLELSLVLVDREDARMGGLDRHLAASPSWQRVPGLPARYLLYRRRLAST
jgi:hypothetical protein